MSHSVLGTGNMHQGVFWALGYSNEHNGKHLISKSLHSMGEKENKPINKNTRCQEV